MDDPNLDNNTISPDEDVPSPPSESIELTPAEPEFQEAAPESVITSAEPAEKTPAPISPEPDAAIAPSSVVSNPTSPPVVTSPGGGKKRGRKFLALVVIIILLAVAGAVVWHQTKHTKKSVASTQSKDIPLLKIGFQSANFGGLYPDMSANDYGFAVNSQMFEGLVRYENKSKIVPDLASTWTNPDSDTWVFTIEPNVRFHDGHTMTAADVKYSLDQVIASKSDLAQTFASTITAVDLVGTNQVKITTSAPDPTLLNKLSFLYVIDANAPKSAEPSQAGSGPYEIKPGTVPGDNSYQMVAFDGYHGGRPTTRALSYSSVDSSAKLVQAFRAHQYDIVGYVPQDTAAKVPGSHTFLTSESDIDFIGFNTVTAGPLQSKLVREAIRYTVNPKALGKARSSDVTPLSQMIPPSIPGYNPAISTYKQNISKAKELLAQAGYPNGLTLRYSTSGDSPEFTTEFTSEMKQVGITLTIDKHTDFDEFINYFSSGKAEMFSIDYSSDTLDGLDIYQTTLQSANYDNPKLTALLDQAGATVDPAKRLKLLQDAAVIVDQDVAVVPLSTEQDTWLMDKNYAIQQDTASAYLPVYFYKVHLK